jgi:hypothetical protein
MRLNFIRAALSLDLNNSTLAHDAVGPSTPTRVIENDPWYKQSLSARGRPTSPARNTKAISPPPRDTSVR